MEKRGDNYQPADGVPIIKINRSEDMAIYDRMPPVLREAIRMFPYPISATETLEVWESLVNQHGRHAEIACAEVLAKHLGQSGRKYVRHHYLEQGFNPTEDELEPI